MISVIKAIELIAQHTTASAVEEVPLPALHGRVLRELVAAAEDVPAFDRSAMDGYAIRTDDLSANFAVVAEIRAGQSLDRSLQPGEAIRIFTGARLPGPDLKVVMQEHTEVQGSRLHMTGPTSVTNVRHRGEDARAGEVLLKPGTRLDATAIAVLASVGKTSVRVSKAPRILHVTTGDEIISPEQTPAAGQIRNSNAALIAGLCRESGVEAITHFHAPDDLPALLKIVVDARPEAYDMILISGGSGPGNYDFSGEVFKHLGAAIHFREVNVRPGKPLIFGTATNLDAVVAAAVPSVSASRSEDRPPLGTAAATTELLSRDGRLLPRSQIIFGLPGNALSHFVCFHLFVRRAISRLLGLPLPMTIQAFLSDAMPETHNARETWWPARAGLHHGRLECHALAWKSSGDITRLPNANALLYVPASTSRLDVGSMVELIITRPLF